MFLGPLFILCTLGLQILEMVIVHKTMKNFLRTTESFTSTLLTFSVYNSLGAVFPFFGANGCWCTNSNNNVALLSRCLQLREPKVILDVQFISSFFGMVRVIIKGTACYFFRYDRY